MTNAARKAAEWLMSLTHNLAALLLAIASVLVIWQVFTRFVLGSASGWSEVASRAFSKASRRAQVARSGQSSHLRKERRLTQGARASGPSMTRITSAKLTSAAGRARV